MATEFKTIEPKKYYEHFLQHDVRPDGRQMESFRPVSVSVGSISTANGSSLVKLKNTIVLCGVKAELSNPVSEGLDKGFIIPNVELPALCSSRFKPGPPPIQAQLFSQLVFDVVKDSDCIKLEELCICKGKLCWCLYVDVTCLNYDGNILDACMISVMAALKNTFLPKVSCNIEDDSISVSDETVPLKMNFFAFSSTFCIFENTIVADPTGEEENLSNGVVNIMVRDDGMLCGINKPGGSALEEVQLSRLIHLSKKRSEELVSIVKGLSI